MSKERARRREEREREAAVLAAAQAREAERRERRRARVTAVTGRLPQRSASRFGGRQTGVLAERRRRQSRGTVAVVVALNVLVWAFVPDWSARAMALVVSLLVAPVLYVALTRR